MTRLPSSPPAVPSAVQPMLGTKYALSMQFSMSEHAVHTTRGDQPMPGHGTTLSASAICSLVPAEIGALLPYIGVSTGSRGSDYTLLACNRRNGPHPEDGPDAGVEEVAAPEPDACGALGPEPPPGAGARLGPAAGAGAAPVAEPPVAEPPDPTPVPA